MTDQTRTFYGRHDLNQVLSFWLLFTPAERSSLNWSPAASTTGNRSQKYSAAKTPATNRFSPCPMLELTFVRTGHLRWFDRPAPTLQASTDALVRPFVASRCDGDTLPLHRPVSWPMQAGLKLRLLAPVIGHIVGQRPFHGLVL